MSNQMYLSARILREMEEKLTRDPISPGIDAYSFGGRQHLLSGIDLIESPMFPNVSSCERCAGTGEGTDSTYCKRCKGGGKIKYHGMMMPKTSMLDLLNMNKPLPQPTLIVEYFPKVFQPRFPVPVPLRKI